MRRCRVAGVVLLFGASGGLEAEDLGAARACVAVEPAAARLACYDAAFGVGEKTPAARFGDDGQLAAEAAAVKAVPAPPRAVTAIVRAAVPLPQGLFRLTLDNGQVWQTREADWAVQFASSDPVTISRLPLGGYQISVGRSNRSIGVKRLQ